MRMIDALELDDEEQEMLRGGRGDGVAMAMRILVGVARAMRAPRLIGIASAHIDGCVYYGQAGLDFAERLVALEARVSVPTTLNIGLVDLMHPELMTVGEQTRDAAQRQMEAYVTLGGRATFTCAPYQTDHRPGLGEQVAWAESNAIVFVNSVLGARTNRYGDFVDVAAAICGRVPDAGLHRAENRYASVVFDVSGLSGGLARAEIVYPILGLIVGAQTGDEIPVIVGLSKATSEDQLKALGAAAASSGAVALFHAVGVTPEAATLRDALGGREPSRRVVVDAGMLRAARDALGGVRSGATIDAVAVGTPHASLTELQRIRCALAGDETRVPLYVNTGRAVLAVAERVGLAAALRASGVTIIVDTCTYVSPIVREIQGVVMTSSAKWAYYAPGNIGVSVAFGSLEECVRSAVGGVVWRDDAVW
jgi:predicted aconitase